MPNIYKCIGTKMTKKFFGVFRGQRVMKRMEMQKKNFRFLDRLPYFPFYRTIVLNVKVKIGRNGIFLVKIRRLIFVIQ